MGLPVGPPKGVGAVGQFPGQREGIGWRLGRSGGRRGVGLSQGGQIHIRRGRVFRSRSLCMGAKRRQGPKSGSGGGLV